MYIFLKERFEKLDTKFNDLGFLLKVLFVIGAFITSVLASNASNTAQNSSRNIEIIKVDGHDAEYIYINTVQGRFKFTAEIANTPEKTQNGLMFRESMPHNHGMLFNFHKEKEVLMWMKNTPLSLDMVFLSPTGRVVNIVNDTKPYSESIISSKNLASGVLEINAGTSKLLGLKTGDLLEHRSFHQKNNGVLKEKAN